MINMNFYINAFNSNLETFEKLLNKIDKEQLARKQYPQKWSLIEVICHLYDEEREDFRARLKLVLETPDKPFPTVNPQGWVTERNYTRQNFETMLQMFIQERKNSIGWLKYLDSPGWDNVHMHPKPGSISAKLILANWFAHDYLHIRQITKLKYDNLKKLSNENLSYAGDW